MNNLGVIYENLSEQAKWAVFTGVLMIVNTLVMFFYLHSAKFAFLGMVLLVLFAGLFVYQMNCLIKGGCKTLGWVYVGTALFTQVIHSLSLLAFILGFSHIKPHFSTKA